MALEAPLVPLGIVAKFDSATPVAVEPDGEAVVVEPEDFGGSRAE